MNRSFRPRLAPRLLGLVIGIIAVLTMTACATLETRERASVLRVQVLRYAKSLRWGDYEGANAFIRRKEDTEVKEDLPLLRKIQVTNYQVLSATMADDRDSALSRIRLSYFHSDRRIESTITDVQTWYFDEEASAWFIDGNLPDFAAGLRRTTQ
ncbi:MAG: hypothetical protein AAF493_01370 [Pseudomonadota bacterium]